MNKLQKINSQAELEQLIERYFDGETSLQEEQLLKQTLADCTWTSDTIDEARFTMGYFTAHKQQQRRIVKMTTRRRIIGIAASIAVLLTVGASALSYIHQSQGVCLAYVNGKAINNEDEVMELISKDLSTMDVASHSMEAQLLSISEALELDNN
ncbi:MAG: hypothetical protein IKZ92_04340 [Muribaculaceae bacterium]|nr:hypothetical protein [Muribaculaceae bacterium]